MTPSNIHSAYFSSVHLQPRVCQHHTMSSADLLTQITDLVLASEEEDLAEVVTLLVVSARQLVSGSDFTVSLAPVAAIGSFLMIVGLAPFAGFWNESQS